MLTSKDVDNPSRQNPHKAPRNMLDQTMKIYDRDGKRVAKRVLDKVGPGELYGYNRMGCQVWKEDLPEDSGSQSEGPDEDFFKGVREGPVEARPDGGSAQQRDVQVVCTGEQQQRTQRKAGGRSERRLNFCLGNALGEQRCIEAMKAIENEGEAPFTHKLVAQTSENIV